MNTLNIIQTPHLPCLIWQDGNNLARAKVRCVCCVVSFPKFHYNDKLTTSRRCGEMCAMGFELENTVEHGAGKTYFGKKPIFGNVLGV